MRIVRLVPIWLMTLIIPLTYLVSMGRGFSQVLREFDFMQYDRIEYLFTQARVLITYLRILIWPSGLVLDYDYPLYTSFWTPAVMLSFLAHGTLLALCGYLYKRSQSRDPELRLAAFGIAWFYLFHSLESSIITFSQLYLEYRLYLPSLGFFLAVTAAMFYFQKMIGEKYRFVPAAAAAIVFLALSLTTYARNVLWSNEIAFWEDNVRKSPTRFVPYYSLGRLYAREGRLDDAIRAYESALRIQPLYVDAYAGLAGVQARQGRVGDAINTYQKALAVNPDFLRARQGLGILYDDLGRSQEAIREFTAALRIDPSKIQGHIDLGIAYLRAGKNEAAIQEFQRAVTLDPKNADSRKVLGMAYGELGLHQEAIAQFHAALDLDPGRADIRGELDRILGADRGSLAR